MKSLDLESSILPVDRALGVQWDTNEDTFGIKIKCREQGFTRRGVLRTVSSLYDPLGMVCPFVLEAKRIFQNKCKTGKCWDDQLEPENIQKWTKWMADLPQLQDFKIERCLIPENFGDVAEMQIHHFCDASQEAYGTVSYLRLVNNKGNVHCSFIMGKSRLAPIKPMTIPRLELSAAVLAVKVDSLIEQELKLQCKESIFWCDSMIVLQYIKNMTKRFQKKKKTSVANRVAIIHDGSQPTQWRYVDSNSNPADDASRGLQAKDMLTKKGCLQGPEFL